MIEYPTDFSGFVPNTDPLSSNKRLPRQPRPALIASQIIEDGVMDDFISHRYQDYRSDIGLRIINGQAGFDDLEAFILQKENR